MQRRKYLAAPGKVKGTWRDAQCLQGCARACQVDRQREHRVPGWRSMKPHGHLFKDPIQKIRSPVSKVPFPVTPAPASPTPPNACAIYGATRLVWQLLYTASPCLVCSLLRGTPPLRGGCESPENRGCLFHLCLPRTQLSAVPVNIKQATDICCWRRPNG